jgi:two-component system response regulator HydG
MSEPRRILVVEHLYALREGIACMLRRNDYEVTTAGDATTAWNLIHTEHVDVALTTLIGLKPFHGFELIRRIMGDFPNIEVVAMSASSTLEVELEALRLGAREFLYKPFTEDQLLIRLERTLEYRWLKNRALGPSAARSPWMPASFLVGKH